MKKKVEIKKDKVDGHTVPNKYPINHKILISTEEKQELVFIHKFFTAPSLDINQTKRMTNYMDGRLWLLKSARP